MDLRRDDHLSRQDQVDHAAGGAPDRNFDETVPARAEAPDQHLDDRGLVPIADRRSGRRIEAKADVEPENGTDRREHGKARLSQPALDQGQVGRVDTRRPRHGPDREAGVDAGSTKIQANPSPQLSRDSTGRRARVASMSL